jgi:hypothetical protein
LTDIQQLVKLWHCNKQHANQKREQGLPKLQAVQEAAISRLRPIMMTSLHRGMTTQKTHPMRNLTTANRAIRAHAAQNAMSVLSALQITGMQIAARAAITATTLTMPLLASTLPYCRLPLQYRPVKTMPPKSQRVSPVPAA